MTEKRKNIIADSYSPVVDIPGSDHNPSPLTPLPDEISVIPSAPREKNRGRKVKPGRRGASETSSHERVVRRSSPSKSGEKSDFNFAKVVEFFHSQTFRWVAGIAVGCFAVYLLVAFVSYLSSCIEDQAAIINSPVGSLPPVKNRAGEGGARLSEFLVNGSFGLGSVVIIIWLGAIAMKLLSGWPKFKTVNFTIKCLVALITVSLIIGLVTIASDTQVNWGGYHGRYVNEFIIGFLGWTGAVILSLMLVAIFFVICLRDIVNWVIRKKNEIVARRREAARIRREQEELERELNEMRLREEIDAVRAGESAAAESAPVDEADNAMQFSGHEAEIDPSLMGYDLEDEPDPRASSLHIAPAASESAEAPAPSESSAPSENSENSENSEPSENSELSDSSENSENEKSDKMVVNVNNIAKADNPSPSGSLKTMYRFPTPDLLRPGEHKVTVDIKEQQANQERIRETLLYHKIPITQIDATVGPTVTLYEIRPEQGVKIARIKNLADDIALSLAAKGVRVIAPIPGKGTVGIEVANAEPQTVSMRTIIESRKYAESRYRLPVAMGATIGNEVYIADLTKMPHLLVAGATGQGKSVGLNTIIASLLYKKRPDELKFVMIDPKEVEFSLYARIENHYLAKLEDGDAIVTDMSRVVPTLQSLCVEMDNRYKLLRAAEVRNLEEYNAKFERNQLDPAEGHRFLPYIVLVVDEFADLIMTSGKEVETPIARIAQKARAIGIHAIIATQRPSTNVITGIIKANFPVRIAFRVSSGVDSKTILDTTGAQQLIGKGDMLISNNSELVRVQCAFIDTPEVEEICNYVQSQPFNSGPYILPDPGLADVGDLAGGPSPFPGGEALDPLLEEVAELVITSGVGSTSGIQRRFSIGYNRAGKIMDQLEHYGVVGPSMGGKPRQVLMDMYGLQELLKNLK